jgi:hypothetical protein
VSPAAASALLADLAAGRTSVAQHLDPWAGLRYQVIEGEDDPGYAGSAPVTHQGHLCDPLPSRPQKVVRLLVQGLKSNLRYDVPPECSQQGPAVECGFQDAQFEYATAFDVHFIPCARGICIDGVDSHAGGMFTPSAQDADHAAFEAFLAAPRGADCED